MPTPVSRNEVAQLRDQIPVVLSGQSRRAHCRIAFSVHTVTGGTNAVKQFTRLHITFNRDFCGLVVPAADPRHNVSDTVIRQLGHGAHRDTCGIHRVITANTGAEILQLPAQIPVLHARQSRCFDTFIAPTVGAVTGRTVAVVKGLPFRRSGGKGDQLADRQGEQDPVGQTPDFVARVERNETQHYKLLGTTVFRPAPHAPVHPCGSVPTGQTSPRFPARPNAC